MARLRQVLINLVSNAVKFTNQGGVYLVASLLPAADNKLVIEFTVKDTGIGISPEKCDRLFQPFSQLDSSMTRKYGGTGLGLAICKSLVGMMGGDIRVESMEEKGLPLYSLSRLPCRRKSWKAAAGKRTVQRTS